MLFSGAKSFKKSRAEQHASWICIFPSFWILVPPEPSEQPGKSRPNVLRLEKGSRQRPSTAAKHCLARRRPRASRVVTCTGRCLSMFLSRNMIVRLFTLFLDEFTLLSVCLVVPSSLSRTKSTHTSCDLCLSCFVLMLVCICM